MSVSKFLISSFLLLLSIYVKSQDISKYLDDGSKGTARAIISVGFDPVNGSLPVKFERRVAKNFAYVIAVAPLLIEKQKWYDEEPSIKKTGIGVSASIRAKFYFREFPERMYVNLYPQITIMDGKVFIEPLISLGYQRVIFRKIVINTDIGFGFRIFNDTCFGVLEGETAGGLIPYVPVSINIGYLF
jgi:hypothetical protein